MKNNLYKIDLLLILRGFACLLVIVSHSWSLLNQTEVDNAMTFWHRNVGWIVRGNGDGGVWIFFVLSGYLMGKGFWTARYQFSIYSVAKFYLNRALRILPVYLIALGLTALALGSEPFRPYPQTLWQLLTFRYKDGNLGPLWSISTEVQFYIFVPALTFCLIKIASNASKINFLLILLFGSYCYYFAHLMRRSDWNYNVYWTKIHTPLLSNLPLFLCGILINAWLPLHKTLLARLNPLTRSEFLLSLFIGMFVFAGWSGCYMWRLPTANMTFWGQILQPILFALWAAFIIILAESPSSYSSSASAVKRKALKFFEYFGKQTYGIYVFHCLALYWLLTNKPFVGSAISRITLTFLTLFTFSFACSVFFYYVVEKPIEKFKAK